MNKVANAEKAASKPTFRELTERELEFVSGGVKYECTVKVDSKGNKSIECKISGSF